MRLLRRSMRKLADKRHGFTDSMTSVSSSAKN